MSFTSYRSDAILLLIEEYFGPTAVILYKILQTGPKTFKNIHFERTDISLIELRHIIGAMIQFEFISCVNRYGTWEYALNNENIQYMLYYPRYILFSRETYGVEGKSLVQELILNGSMKNSLLCQKVVSYLSNIKDHDDSFVERKVIFVLNDLLKEGFITKVTKLKVDDLPDSGFEELGESEEKEYYLTINHDRFLQEFKIEFVLNAIKNRFDPHAALLIKYFFKLAGAKTTSWSPSLNPVPIAYLKDAIISDANGSYVFKYFDQYIKLLEEDPNFYLTRSNDYQNGLMIDIDRVLNKLVNSTLSSIVEYRFGGKAARIFRVIVDKNCCELEQIQKLAMLPDKEVKQISYKLLEERFIKINNLKSSSSGFGSNKSFFLFCSDLISTANVVCDMCYKALNNCIRRRHQEQREYHNLYEKKVHTDYLMTCFEKRNATKEQLLELVSEYITHAEMMTLRTLEQYAKKLQFSEMQILETILLLHLNKIEEEG